MTGTEESGESPYAPPRAPIQPSDPVRGALERAQRAAVIAWWLTLLASVALTFITERWLPPELLAFVERQFAEELADSDWLLVAWLLAALVVALSGSVGTYRLGRAGETMFVLGNAMLYFAVPLAGPYVEHGLAAQAGDAVNVAFGAALVCIVLRRHGGSHADAA